jgi:GH15 family glucan-1,4-alpha-glucosidase
MNKLYQRSIEIILKNQSSNGAFVASPNFPTYHFCWFRDSSFVAYAMDLAGQHKSAYRFHQWAAERINERESQILASIEKARAGETLQENDILHTRYRLDGLPDEPGLWPNFQLDGFGTWIWALQEHIQMTKQEIPTSWGKAADLVADYLSSLWSLPCYDCWEEFPDHVHPHTLAAIYGGLKAHTKLSNVNHGPALDAIREYLFANAVEHGHFVKFSGSPEVDASLLGLAVPYGVVTPDDPRMLRTIEKIEQTLLHEGGLHRYASDTYYGGGVWTLLSAWLGWYYHELAKCNPSLARTSLEKSAALKVWI